MYTKRNGCYDGGAEALLHLAVESRRHALDVIDPFRPGPLLVLQGISQLEGALGRAVVGRGARSGHSRHNLENN